MYWNMVKVEDIEKVGGTGGSFNNEGRPEHTYFSLTMKDGSKHTFHYANRDAEKFRKEIKKIFNECNKVKEYYLLENDVFIRIDGKSILYGCRVEDNMNDYKYKTLVEIEKLGKEGKIVDEGWRHLLYICQIEIKDGKVIHGLIDDVALEQIEALGYDFDIDKGVYRNGIISL